MSNAPQMIRSFYAHLDANAGDFSALSQYVDPALRFHVPGAPEPLGLTGFRAFVDEIYAAFPDLSHDVSFQLSEGNRVATRMTVSGTHRGQYMGQPTTHKRVAFTVHSICAFEDGKLTDYWLEADLLGLQRQLTAA